MGGSASVETKKVNEELKAVKPEDLTGFVADLDAEQRKRLQALLGVPAAAPAFNRAAQASMASASDDKVAFQVMTLGNSDVPVVSAAAGTTVRELRELVAAAMEAESVALKLVVGDLLLEDNDRPVQEACAEAWAAAVAEQRPVDLMVVKHLSPAKRAELGRKLRDPDRDGGVADIKALLEAGAEVNAYHSDGGPETALMSASMNGHVEAVTLLVEAGADIEIRSLPWGLTALMFSTISGHVEAVKFLVEAGAKLNTVTVDGKTALYIAEDRGRTKTINGKTVAEYLRSKGATT